MSPRSTIRSWTCRRAKLSLLEILLQRPGRLVSKEQLVDRLCSWGEEVSNNAIEVYVHRLRRENRVRRDSHRYRARTWLLPRALYGRNFRAHEQELAARQPYVAPLTWLPLL